MAGRGPVLRRAGQVPLSRRRIRHDARDQMAAAGLSLAASVAASGMIWLLAWWLG